MKKLTFAFCAIMMFVFVHAQENYKINENTYKKISISFTFGDLEVRDIQNDEGIFSRVFMEGCCGSKIIGEPELPVSVNILEIPIFANYIINIYEKDYVIHDAKMMGINYPVFPAQRSVSKSHDGPVEFIQNKQIYQTNAFYALPLARFEEVGIMRNINLGELYVSQVQYNPVTHEVKIFKEFDVEILFNQVELVKTQALKNLHSSPLFRCSNVINPMKTEKTEFSNTPIKYLIVAHSMFRGELEEFMEWKKRKGFLVEIGYTDDENVGKTTDSIASYIKSHYTDATPENPAPTFVLLVGDVQQIPAFLKTDGTGKIYPTDLYYFTWADNSYFPCCYYGRFSAQNSTQLSQQIQKTIRYEQYAMHDPSYLNKISLIAGYDRDYAPTYANGFLNYVTKYYAHTDYGYSTVYAHFHPCNTSAEAAQIRAEIGAGVGIANYTAHGSPFGWSNPSFNLSHIQNMNNVDKYGLMIGNCCESSKFDNDECFAEALLRAEGKGAVGYIGASNLTYWDEDYYWGIGYRFLCTVNPVYSSNNLGSYDRLFHTHGETYNKWMTTFGSIIVAGNEAVQASFTDIKQYYWEIYHLMGDPSVMPYLKKPTHMEVKLVETNLENYTLTVIVAPYSYCALTHNDNELISAGFADDNGNITLKLNPDNPEDYEFSAWAQNYIPYITKKISVNDFIPASFSVYPNPTTGELTITNYELRIENIEVFDVYGRIQNAECRMQNAISSISVDISDFKSGVYFVKIKTEKGTITKKIIKN
jgi:hypothetical protein